MKQSGAGSSSSGRLSLATSAGFVPGQARSGTSEMAVVIGGKRLWLWRAVDSEGEILDILVQPRRDRAAALRLMRKLSRKQGYAPDVLVTDRLACDYASTSRAGH